MTEHQVTNVLQGSRWGGGGGGGWQSRRGDESLAGIIKLVARGA